MKKVRRNANMKLVFGCGCVCVSMVRCAKVHLARGYRMQQLMLSSWRWLGLQQLMLSSLALHHCWQTTLDLGLDKVVLQLMLQQLMMPQLSQQELMISH